MGMPVKLSDELVTLARCEAEASQRSIAGQVEHWARVGRAVERGLQHEDTLALKRGLPLLETFPEPGKLAAVLATLVTVAGSAQSCPVQERAQRGGRPVYASDPRWPGQVVRIEADGTRVPGRFENRQFVPLA